MERKRLSTSAAEAATAGTTEAIHVKYRPRSLRDVLGQKAVVKSLRTALDAKARPHTYLFTGPKGTGKTTLARIVGDEVGCDPASVVEVNAAVTSGVDDMRALLAPLMYEGFGDRPNKLILVDEAHRLSKQTWDVLLKDTEEPAAHVFFVFCSTEPEKIPATIVSRCAAYHLSPLRHDDIMDILDDVCAAEKYDTEPKVIEMVARACEGSARAALTMLALVQDSSAEDAEVLLQAPSESKEVIDLCRQMVKGGLTRSELCKTLKAIDVPAESVRIVVVNYLSACALGARSDKDAVRILDMLECFLKPCNPSDKMGPLLAAFGRYIFA